MRERILGFVRRNAAVLIVLSCAILALAAGTVETRDVSAAVDWRLLAVLFAMLVAAELLRTSHALDHLAHRALRVVSSARGFAAMLVTLSGALAAVVTNDVALFICIPFTFAAARVAQFEPARLVMLQIVATNLLGCVSPIGNPQNLYLFHLSGWTVLRFIRVMLPFCATALVILVILSHFATPRGRVLLSGVALPAVRRSRATYGAVALLLVVGALAQLTPLWIAIAVAAPAAVALRLDATARLDLSIVPLFLFAFVATAGLRNVLASLTGVSGDPAALFVTTIVASQLISNVPATILFAPAAEGQLEVLLYAANAGGCGTIIASLANLLGWQIYRQNGGSDRNFVGRFTALNSVLLLAMSAIAWLALS